MPGGGGAKAAVGGDARQEWPRPRGGSRRGRKAAGGRAQDLSAAGEGRRERARREVTPGRLDCRGTGGAGGWGCEAGVAAAKRRE